MLVYIFLSDLVFYNIKGVKGYDVMILLQQLAKREGIHHEVVWYHTLVLEPWVQMPESIGEWYSNVGFQARLRVRDQIAEEED
jgi:hypothetical protein